jgi:hypothetical protein
MQILWDGNWLQVSLYFKRLPFWTIDYRCGDGEKLLRGEVCVIRLVLTSSFRTSRSSPLKNEPVSQEISTFEDISFRVPFEIVKF